MISKLIEEKLVFDKDYGVLYCMLIDWVRSKMRQCPVVYQINHGLKHSEQLKKNMCLLLTAIQERNNLNSETLFVAFSSVYLHDIGMFYGWEEFLGLKRYKNLSIEEKKLIRRNHAKISGNIIRSFKEKIPKDLENKLSNNEKKILKGEINECLAYVCENHNTPYCYSEVEKKESIMPVKIDLVLLTGLIQTCDAFHMDNSRVDKDFIKNTANFFAKKSIERQETFYKDIIKYLMVYYITESNVITKGNIIEFKINWKMPGKYILNNEYEKFIIFLKNNYERKLRRNKKDCLRMLKDRSGVNIILSPVEEPCIDDTLYTVPKNVLDALIIQ